MPLKAQSYAGNGRKKEHAHAQIGGKKMKHTH